MPIVKYIAVAVVAAGLAGAAVMITLRSVPRGGTDDATSAQLAAMQAELDAIREQASRQGVLLGHVVRAGAGASPRDDRQQPAPMIPSSPAPAPEAKQPPEATVETLAAHFGDTFESQGADPAWSQGAEGTVSREVGRRLPAGSSVQSVQCRKSMCQIRSSHASMDSYEKFTEDALYDRGNGLWNAAITSLVVDRSGDVVKSISYVAREGHALPSLEASN